MAGKSASSKKTTDFLTMLSLRSGVSVLLKFGWACDVLVGSRMLQDFDSQVEKSNAASALLTRTLTFEL